MVRMILISVLLLGMVLFFIYRWQAMVTRSQPPIVTRVDVYSDRLTYRNGVYPSASRLAIALQANNAMPEIVEVRECGGVARLGEVLEVIRRYGAVDFQIVLPENC